jgi:hypothetical protein
MRSLNRYRKKRGLNIAAIPNCEFWVDVARTNTITFVSGANVSQVRDLSGKSRHLTKTGSGNDTIYPVHVPAENGLRFLSGAFDQMIAGAIGNWNFLHNGNGCTVLALVKIDTAQAANGVILSTSSEAASGVGFNLWYYNTNQNMHTIVRNGAAQTFSNSGATNSLQKTVPKILSAHIENRAGNPPDMVTRVNGATDLRLNALSTFSASNSTGPLFIGKLPDAASKCSMVFKKCAIFSRRLSKAEENMILEEWARTENISLTRYPDRTLAVLAGQSNARGRGLISDTEFATTPAVTNARIFNSTGFSWATLTAGTNNDAFSTTTLGLEMNLAKQFITLTGQAIDLVKSGVHGTPITSWDIANSNFINLKAAMQRARWELEDAGNVVRPLFIWYQGESDALTTAEANLYQGRLGTFITNILNHDGFVQAPFYVVQISQSPTQPGTATVINAGVNLSVTSPTSAYVRSVEISDIATNLDENHINAVSLNAVALRIVRRFLGLPG